MVGTNSGRCERCRVSPVSGGAAEATIDDVQIIRTRRRIVSAVIDLTTALVPLDADNLADLRRALLSERSKHLEVAQVSRTSAAEFGGQDGAHSIVERQTATAAGIRAGQMIAEIEAALARIDSGTYGLCELCGKAIPLARLLALPHTRRCVECAEAAVSATPRRAGSILVG